MSDHYKTLGITKDAKLADIKKAYRKLALKYHPDKAGDDKEAVSKFREISDAYDTLSNEDKRKAYDNPNPFGGNPFGGNPFDGFSGFNGAFNNFTHRKPATKKGRNISAYVSVTIEEMLSGTTKKVKLNRKTRCTSCNGTGAEGEATLKCDNCQGTGSTTRTVPSAFGNVQLQEECHICNGAGVRPLIDCKSCNASGTVRTEEEIDVNIPKGSIPGISYMIIAKGEYEKAPSNPGDLIVNIEEYLHPVYVRDGLNLVHDKFLTFKEACLGLEFEISNLKGSAYIIKIPPGTQSGKIFRLAGKGIPEANGFGIGDILVKTHVKIPTELTEDQINALSHFN
jgi:molecular chaperone DnaJ